MSAKSSANWNPFAYPPSAVAKAAWGFFLPGAGVLLNAYTGDSPVTTRDWVVALLTCVVTGYGVFKIQNKGGADGEGELGEVGVVTLVAIVLILAGALALFGVLSLLVVGIVALVAGILLLLLGYSGRW